MTTPELSLGIIMRLKFAILCCACAAFWLPPAAAQQQVAVHPADPRALVPPPQYASAFNGYRPYGNEKPGPWREINDEVARIGGHAGMFRTPAAQGAAPAANPHAHHHPGAAK
jgi:hypothetical protein